MVLVLYISDINLGSHLIKTVLGMKWFESLSWPGLSPLLASFQPFMPHPCCLLLHLTLLSSVPVVTATYKQPRTTLSAAA